MKWKTTRNLRVAPRMFKNQAEDAIRGDVVRALVELITNSNDSYCRIETAGSPNDGTILVEVTRKHSGSVVRVTDHAEGMSEEQLEVCLGSYGEGTSGFAEGQSVRGQFGRGLKDAILGLGQGRVLGFSAGHVLEATLGWENDACIYRLRDLGPTTPAQRKKFDVPDSGTVVEITLDRDDVRMPQMERLRHHLSRHYELRDIVTADNRSLVLRANASPRREEVCKYATLPGDIVLDEDIVVAENEHTAHLRVFRSPERLSTPREEKPYSDGGLLVHARHLILDCTLFNYDDDVAEHFWGTLDCDHLYELLSKEPPEPIISQSRDGIRWDHPFTRGVRKAAEKAMAPLVADERERLRQRRAQTLSKGVRDRIKKALSAINAIAKSELGSTGGEGAGQGLMTPPDGFDFVPQYYSLQVAKRHGLRLLADLESTLEAGTPVELTSDNPDVRLLVPSVVIEPREDDEMIGQANVHVEGLRVGAEAIITAIADDLKAEALVKVVSKRPPPEPTGDKRRYGLFSGVAPDPAADPRQRVRFDSEEHVIFVATAAPSVSPYLADFDEGMKTAQGQVLVAELITEAVCREIARRRLETGRVPALSGAEQDAMQREHQRLQHEYAHKIHQAFVDAKHRGV